MTSTVANPGMAAAVAALGAAVDEVLDADLTPGDSEEAAALIAAVEDVARRVDALQVEVVGAVQRSGVHALDGHRSAKAMVAHVAKLSGGEATRRDRVARMFAAMPAVRTAARAGSLPMCMVGRIGAAQANRRIADRLPAAQERLVAEAQHARGYDDFDGFVTDLVTLLDEDGARDRNDRAHDARNATLVQHYDQTWSLHAELDSLGGAHLNTIFDHFCRAERLADWDHARATHGDGATADDLERSEAQRRADALLAMADQAAATPPGSSRPGITTVVVVDPDTFEHTLAQLFGRRSGARGADAIDGFRCSTLDGHRIEPTAAVAAAMVGHVQRAVYDAASTVVDMGRRVRLYTGTARIAAQLASPRCYWPGCWLPATQCEIDHLTSWEHGGETNPANAGPGCRRHNRFKWRSGFTVTRDPTGRFHVHRPDGTEV